MRACPAAREQSKTKQTQQATVAHQRQDFLSASAPYFILSSMFKYCGLCWTTDRMSLSGNLLSANQSSFACRQATKSAEMQMFLFP